MNAVSLRRAVAALACLLAGACGGADEPPAAMFGSSDLRVEVALPDGAPREGANALELRVRDAHGAAIDDAEIEIAYRMDMAGMAPMGGSVKARPLGEGAYRAELELGMAGTWQLALEAKRPSGARAHADGSLRTGAPGLRLEAGSGEGDPDEIGHYTCPMHPSVHAAAPGKCPICGMDLVPVTRSEAESGVVRVDEARLQQIGVRFAVVERAPFVRTLRTTGTVGWDETRLVDVSLKVRGWVRGLRASSLGAPVRAGEVLFEVYSPELFAAQQEYVAALAAQRAARATGAPERADALVRAARARLRLWDIANADLDRLAARGEASEALPVRSPASGFVIEKEVVEGGAIEPGARLLRIAPLDRVWIDTQLFESDVAQVAVGQPARVSAPSAPGLSFEARVAYVYPALVGETRAARVRLELANPEAVLRPGMYVDVALDVDLGTRLVVPSSAVIYAGPRRVVFVDLGGGRLQPRTVQTGVTSDTSIEITDGLAEGERVVASGNFLIAAESRLRSALEQW